MGTRADFYVGHGQEAIWLGSIALDGYRIHDVTTDYNDILALDIATAPTAEAYCTAVQALLASVRHATRPEHGWPWPWNDSCTTDYAYCFVDGGLECYWFGSGPVGVGEPFPDEDGNEAIFPDMQDRQHVTLGARSGLFIVSA